MNAVLLMMGGSGTRFGADIPKQYVLVDGQPVFSYILEKYNRLSCVDKIIIVSHKDWISYVREQTEYIHADKVYKIVAGGSTRSESVKNGLVCAHEILQPKDVVLMHDATHPYVDEEGTAQVIEAVKQYGGATLASFNYDTVYRMDDEQILTNVEPRSNIVAGASPEGFLFGDIYNIYRSSDREELEQMTSAGAIALAHGIRMKVVKANVLNIKITYAQDMELFQQLVHNYFFK